VRLGLRTNPLLALSVAAMAIAQLALVYVPALQQMFGTQPLSAVELAVVLAASASGFVAVEGEKWVQRHRRMGATRPDLTAGPHSRQE
jgi:P-type Ca2+ transporter type 2C